MGFVRNVIGGAIIMALATLIGITHNAVRSQPIKLFPKMAATPLEVPIEVETKHRVAGEFVRFQDTGEDP